MSWPSRIMGGLPTAGDPAASPTLGMTIIRSLAAQLGGEVAWSNTTGTTARLTFPVWARADGWWKSLRGSSLPKGKDRNIKGHNALVR